MKRVTFATLILSAQLAVAGTNGLDSNFGSGGVLPLSPTPQSGLVLNSVKAIKTLADGTFLLGGDSAGSDALHPSAELAAIGHLNADGSWDTGFGDHGIFVLPYGNAAAPLGGEIHHIVIASDGSILAAGGAFFNSSALAMHTCTLLIKLSSSGVLQSDFAGGGATCFDFAPETGGGTTKGHSESISIEPDDGFLITAPYTNLDHGAAARMLSNGTLDATFGDGGIISVPFPSWLLARQADGNTLIAGGRTSIDVMRIKAGGSTDAQYGTDGLEVFDSHSGGIFTNAMSARLDPQGRLLISNIDFGLDTFFQIGRVDTGGSLDATFNGSQQQPGMPGFASLQIDPDSNNAGIIDALPIADGGILAIGYGSGSSSASDPSRIVVARLRADASYDTAFGDAAHPGWAEISVGSNANGLFARVAATDSSGHVFVSTNITDGSNKFCAALIRLTADRVFDNPFDGPAPLVCPN